MTDRKSDLRSEINDALAQITDPISGKSLPESGRLQGLSIRPGGAVGFVIDCPGGETPQANALRKAAEEAVSQIKDVTKVTVVLTAHADAPSSRTPSSGRVRMRQGDGRAASDASAPQPDAPARKGGMEHVGAVVAVTSAKGGVGKSTVAANLAVACAQLGLRVGLLDADVYGPSIPTMFDRVGVAPDGGQDKKIRPVDAYGVKTMSIGYLADTDAPMVWRGPVATSALMQMFSDVDWGVLDLLLVDTPPGTGDLALTMIQRAPLTGAVIVSTPQEVALADVRRGVAMFRKTHTPVLGLIENMAWLEDPATGSRSYIFGEGGARKMAEELDVPVLGEVPIDIEIRKGGDSGRPVAYENGSQGVIFLHLAEELIARIDGAEQKPPPRIIFD